MKAESGKYQITGMNATLTRTFRREFFKKNPKIKWVIWTITIGAPLLGLLSGIVGVVCGVVLGVITNLLGPYAATKIIEIERHISS